MAETKRYFFFKMEDDFFHQKTIKKLRTIAGGDTYTIIYLKFILLSLKKGGKIYFEGIEDDICKELALDIDEKFENVRMTFDYLVNQSMISKIDDNEYNVNDIGGSIGSITSVGLRVRKHRESKKGICYNETPVKQIDNGESDSYPEKEKKSEKEPKLYNVSTFVKLTRNDYKSLIKSYNNKQGIRWAILQLDAYLDRNEKKRKEYKDHRAVLREGSWIHNNYLEYKRKQVYKSQTQQQERKPLTTKEIEEKFG